ncbi:MAG: hypothetical protein R2856_20885 [Caldilineaceae bacterium]
MPTCVLWLSGSLLPDDEYTSSQMTYDLRRLRLKGFQIVASRVHRYIITSYGRSCRRLL